MIPWRRQELLGREGVYLYGTNFNGIRVFDSRCIL
jgi:hypothetical protein